MSRRIQSLNRAGDTIVEVLLAIAVVSAVLGGAYASASQSSRGLRQSQERGEALKLLESQIELLRSAKAAGYKTPTGPAFCAVQGGERVEFPEAGTPLCSQGTDGRYQLSINQEPLRDYEYIATALWYKLGGGSEQEKITLIYRVEQR